MDHLKLYAIKALQLKIQLKFKIQNTQNNILMDLSLLPSLPMNDTYRYLGMQQSSTIDHTSAKEQIQEVVYKRLKTVLKQVTQQTSL